MPQRRNDPPDDEFDRLWDAANGASEPDEFDALWEAATGASEKPDRRRPASSPAPATPKPVAPTPAPRRGIMDRVGERLSRVNEIMSADLAPKLRGEDPEFQREFIPREHDPVMETLARARMWTGAPEPAPAPRKLEFDRGPQFDPAPIAASPQSSTAVRPRLARPGGPRPGRPALPFEDTGARELTEVDVAGLPSEPVKRRPPIGDIGYRDPVAIAQVRAKAQRVASGKELINPHTGQQYTEDERRRAGFVANNLAARQEREEYKGGVGRRIADVLAMGQVNKEAYADIGGAQREGRVVTEEDLTSLGLTAREGRRLRTEPTMGESVKEEMLPFAAGQLPYLLIGPEAALVRGTARFAAAAGKKGFAEALALSVARGSQRPTSQTIAGRIGQRMVAGGVPGAFTGFGGDMAVELARETPFDEAASMAIANAGLGFLLGGAVQVAAGTVADVTVYPLARKWSSHLQHLKAQSDRLMRERNRATQTEAILDYLESPEGQSWVQSVKDEAANAPLPEEMTPEGAARKAEAQQGIGALLEGLLNARKAEYIDDVALAPDERTNLDPAGPEWWDENLPPEPEGVVVPPPATPGTGRGIPLMITQQMRRELADMGYDPEAVRNMTPQQAWEAISAGKQPDTLPTTRQTAEQRYPPEQPEQSPIQQLDMSQNLERIQAEQAERAKLEEIAETVRRQREERAKKPIVRPGELYAAGGAAAMGEEELDEGEAAVIGAALSTGRLRGKVIDRLRKTRIPEGDVTAPEGRPGHIPTVKAVQFAESVLGPAGFREQVEALRDPKFGHSEPAAMDRAARSVIRWAREQGGALAPAVGLAAGAAASDDEETQAGLGVAAALSTGRIHAGRRMYSRLARHIEALPGKQWDQPRSVKEWMQKLEAGGNFSKAELAIVRPMIEKAAGPKWKIVREGMEDGFFDDDAHLEQYKASRIPEFEKAVEIVPVKEARKFTREDMVALIEASGVRLDETRLTEGGKDIEAGKGLARAPGSAENSDYGEAETRVREEYEEARQEAQAMLDSAEQALVRRREEAETEFEAAADDGLSTLHIAIERGEYDGESFDVDRAMDYITDHATVRGYNSPELPPRYRSQYDEGSETWEVYDDLGRNQPIGTGATEYEAFNDAWQLIEGDETLGNLHDLLDGTTIEHAEGEGFVLRDRDGDELYRSDKRDNLIVEYVEDNYESDITLSDLRDALEKYGDAYYEYMSTESETNLLRDMDIDDPHDAPQDWAERLREAQEEDAEAAEQLLAEVQEREGLRDYDEDFYDLDEDDREFVREGVRRGAVGTVAPLWLAEFGDDGQRQVSTADQYTYVYDPAQPHTPFPREGRMEIVDPDQLALGEFAPPARLPAPNEPNPILKSGGSTKFTTYQRVPGGKNYREILIQWANALDQFTGGHWHAWASTVAHLRMTEHLYTPGEGGDPEIQALTQRRSELGRQQGAIGAQYNTFTAHMNEAEIRANPDANRLAQQYGAINRQVEELEAEYNVAMEEFRRNAEAAAQGKTKPERVLNAFEHQSDWKQRGEAEGYKRTLGPEQQAELAALSKENRDVNNELNLAYTAHENARKAVFKNQGGWGTTEDLASFKPESPEVQAYFATQKRVDELDQRRSMLDSRIAVLSGSGGVPDMPWKEPDQAFGLTSARMLIEAAEGNYDRVAWSTAENRRSLAGLSLEAGKITYDQSVVSAVKRLMKGLGFKDVKIVKIKFDGYEHWSVKLTPEMKTAIKEQGLPMLGILAMTMLTAEQKDDTNDEKLGDLPLAAALAAIGGTIVKRGKPSKADSKFVYFEHRSPVAGLTKLDPKFMGTAHAGAERKRDKRPPMLYVQEVGSYVEHALLKDNLYYVRVPKDALYDVAEDAAGIVKKARNSYGFVDGDKVERLLARMGYIGYNNSLDEGQPYTYKLFGQHDVVEPPAEIKKRTDAAMKKRLREMRRSLDKSDHRGVRMYSNPIGPAIGELRRGGSSAAIAALAVMAHDEENQNISRMSVPLAALAGLSAIGTKRMGKVSRGMGGKLVEQMRKTDRGERIVHFLNPDALLSPEVRDAILAYENLRAKGAARATEFGHKAKKLGPKGDRAVSDVIELESWEDVSALSGDDINAILTVAGEIANEMDELTQMKLAEGLIEPGQALPNYLPRRYAEWEAFDVMANRPRGGGAAGNNPRIKGEKTRTLDIPIREAQRKLDAARASGDAAAIQQAEDAMGEAVAVQLSQRVERGEIREASYRTAYGIEKGYADVAAAQLLKTLRNTRGVVNPDFMDALDEFLAAKALLQGATSRADRQVAESLMDAAKLRMREITRKFSVKGGEYVALPETKALGLLSGMVVKREIATEIAGMPERRGIDKVMRFWKLSKTVFNPGTHVANIISNTVMGHMGGLSIIEQPRFLILASIALRQYSGAPIPDALKKLAEQFGPGAGILRKGAAPTDQAPRDLAETGVLDLNIITADAQGGVGFKGFKNERAMRELLDTTTPETAAVLRDRGVKPTSKGVGAKLNAMGDKTKRVYTGEDNIFRVAMYLKRIEAGDTPEQALAHARDSFGNFRTRSPALRVLRRTIAPFILYPAKAVPAFAKNVVDHPIRYLTMVATWGILNEYAKSEVGEVDEVDVDRRDRNLLGYFFPGFTQLPMQDKEGGKAAIDIARWTPLSSITQPAPPGSLPGTVHPRYPNILSAGGPFIDVAAKIGFGIDPYTGEKRYQKDYPVRRSVGNLIEDVFNTAAPSALGIHRERITEDVQNRDFDKLKTDVLGTIGLRPRYVQPGMVELRATQQLENSMMDAKQELKRALSRSKSPTRDEELLDRYDAYVAQALKNFEKTVGVPPPASIVRELRGEGAQ